MAKPHHNGEHQRVRSAVAQTITLESTCVLCHQLRCPRSGLLLAEAWDLAHDDDRPDVWLGPAHPHCNRKDWARSQRSARGRATRTLPTTTLARSRFGTARRVRESPGQSVADSRESPGQRPVLSTDEASKTAGVSCSLSSRNAPVAHGPEEAPDAP